MCVCVLICLSSFLRIGVPMCELKIPSNYQTRHFPWCSLTCTPICRCVQLCDMNRPSKPIEFRSHRLSVGSVRRRNLSDCNPKSYDTQTLPCRFYGFSLLLNVTSSNTRILTSVFQFISHNLIAFRFFWNPFGLPIIMSQFSIWFEMDTYDHRTKTHDHKYKIHVWYCPKFDNPVGP